MAKQMVLWGCQQVCNERGEKERHFFIKTLEFNKPYKFKNLTSLRIQNTGGDVIYAFTNNTYVEIPLAQYNFEFIGENTLPMPDFEIKFLKFPQDPV